MSNDATKFNKPFGQENDGFGRQEGFGVGKREGKAPIKLESGAVYEGEWFDGQRDGQGK